MDDIIAITETLQHFIVQCGKVHDLKNDSIHGAFTTMESTWLERFLAGRQEHCRKRHQNGARAAGESCERFGGPALDVEDADWCDNSLV